MFHAIGKAVNAPSKVLVAKSRSRQEENALSVSIKASKDSCGAPLSGIVACGWTAVLPDLYAVIGVTDQTS